MTPADERAALLAAVLDSPAEDAPRLVYADWLEEYGGEEDRRRAEFIRCQVLQAQLVCHHPEAEAGDRLARSYCDDTFCPHCSLYRRAYDIEHDVDLTGTIDLNHERSRAFHGMPYAWRDDYSSDWDTWRGFISTVRLPLQAWRDHGRALAQSHPLERVELSDREPANGSGDPLPPGPWFWVGDDRWDEYPAHTHRLPLWLARHLPDCPLPEWETGAYVVRFASRADALDALSSALLAHARLPQEASAP